MSRFNDLMKNRTSRLIQSLGEVVELAGGDEIPAIFDFPSHEGDLDQLPMDFRTPKLTVEDANTGYLKTGSAVRVRGQWFTVGDHFPSGDGVTVIHLTEGQNDPEQGTWR